MKSAIIRALFSLALILIAASGFQKVHAQLPYKESFTKSTAPGMVFGGASDPAFPLNFGFLTANTDSAGVNGNPNDADGAGYLRLTKNLQYQSGFVRNTAKFPSAEGLSITFEYYTHSGGALDYGFNDHADGISIFLFDALASPFQFGALGGSLGYAQRAGGLPGVSKGFLGIGIDEFGNFATNKEGKSGGNQEDTGSSSDTWEGYNESSVTLRGDGDGASNAATNYEWLITKKTYADLAALPTTYPNGFLIRGNVDGRTKINDRTGGGLISTENGYRKVKVDIEPNVGGTFKVNVRITEGKGGVAVPHHVIQDFIYTPTTAAPDSLSYGFGASTGNRTNIHEIRSLDIVVPPTVIKIPVAEADVAVTTKNTPKTFDIISNDHDANGNFQLDLASVDLNPGTLGNQTSFNVPGEGNYVYAVNAGVGQITFTPEATFEGVATPITYTISDNGQDIDGAVISTLSRSAAANITVTVVPPITGTAAVCMGSTTQLANVVSGGTWTSSATGVATVNASTGLVTPVSAGNTTITYTVGGVSGASVIQQVTVNAIPTTPTASVVGGGSTTGCASPGVQLTSSSATGNQWYRDNNLIAGATSQNYTATVTGTYTVIVTTSGCPSAASNGVAVTINPLPTITLTNANPEICFGTGSANITYNVTANGANQYSIDWNGAANTAGIADVSAVALVANNITVSGLAAIADGTYTGSLTVINSTTGCISTAQTVTVKINALPAAPLITGAASFCTGGNLLLTSNGTGAHQWYKDNVLMAGETGTTLTVTAAGVYTVTATQGTACISPQSTGKTVTVTAPAAPAITGSNSFCAGGNLVLTSDGTGSHQWYKDNVLMVGETNATLNVTAAGVYTVTASQGTACVSPQSVGKTITVTALPAAPLVTGGNSFCAGGSVLLTADGAGTYQWYKDNVLITGQTAATLNVTAAGVYTVTSTQGTSCVSAKSLGKTITETALPVIGSIAGASTVAVNATTNYTNTPTGGTWSSDDLTVATVNASTGVVTGVSAGTANIKYTVTSGGCSSEAVKAITVTAAVVNNPPVVQDITKSGLKDTPVTFTAADFSDANHYNDPENVALVRVKIVTLPTPSTGTLKLSGVNIALGDEITLANLPNITFEPASGYTGSATFQWNGSDGVQYATANKNVNITIAATNNPPVVQDITKTGLKDTPVTFTAANFSDANHYSDPEGVALVKVKIVTLPAPSTGTLKLSGVNIALGDEITLANLPNITFEPASGYTGSATFQWNGSDGLQYAAANKNVNITINASNNPPVVQDITKSGLKDTPVTFAASDFNDAAHYNDPEGVALVKVKIVTLPAASTGTLRLSGANIAQGDEISLANLPNITFAPASGYTGSATFQWNGSDGLLYAVANKNVNITIAATNNPPVVQDITKTGFKDIPVTFTAADFSDASHYNDPEGVALVKAKIVSLPSPTVGLLKLSGVNIVAGDEIPLASLPNITFVPTNGYTGPASFLWNGSDGVQYATTNKTVNITINATNNPPVVQDISVTSTGFVPYVFTPTDFSSKFADPELSPLARVRITSLPLSGTLKFNGVVVTLNQEIPAAQLGGLTFEAPVNFNGTIPFGWNGYDGVQYALTPARVNVSIILSGDPTAKIGLAKNLASVKPALNGTYDVKFVFTAVNYGLNALERVSIKDNLSQAFGGAEATVKSVTAFGNLKVNPLYNGTTDTELLLQTSRLSAGEEALVEMLVNVRLQLTSGLFQNTATAEGFSTINGLRVTDVSTNGLKPDPLVSNDVSPSDPTPIQLDVQPLYSPQGFSPNGDGINDAFVIQNAQGKLVSLEVYNRWGNRVYKSADYKNDWTGQVTEGFFLGRDIPDGTYYYVIVIENKDKYVGFITINR